VIRGIHILWVVEPRTRFELVTLAYLGEATKAMLYAAANASTRLSHRGIACVRLLTTRYMTC